MVNWLSPRALVAFGKSLLQRGLQVKADPTYEITSQFYTPGQPIYSDRNYRSFVVEGYKKCGPVYACINKITDAAAGIKWKLYTDRSMKREITSHALLDLWNKPNPRMGASELVEQIFGFWHLTGNSYLYASRLSPNEPPVELWPLYPDQMKIVAGNGDIQGYVYGYGGPDPRVFELDDIMHLKFASYDDRSFYGLSPIEVAMRTVDRLNAGDDWNTAIYQNEGRPSAIFTTKNYLTVEQRNQVKAELRKKYSGKRNAGMPMVLEADMSYQQVALTPKEMDWLESQGFDERRICMIMDVPSLLLSDFEGQTYANRKEAKQSLFTENVLPKMDRTVGHVNVWLLPMFEDLKRMGAYFTYDPKDIEVLAELYTAAEQALGDKATNMWNNGLCSLAYAQELQGVPPVPGQYLDVYKLGPNTLVRGEDLEAYAQGCLKKLSAPPPQPFGALPPHQSPQLPPPGQTTVTEVDGDSKPASGNDEDEEPEKPVKMQGVSPIDNPASRYRRRDGTPIKKEIKILDLTTKEDKAAYMARLEQQRATWEAEIEQRLQDYFKGEQKVVAAALEKCSTSQQAENALESAVAEQESALQQLIYDAWQDVGRHFGDQAAQQFAEAAKVDSTRIARKDTLADIFTTQTIAYLLNLSATKVTDIDATTLEALRKALAEGVAAGEGIPALTKRINQLYLADIIPNRSQTISRTEVVAASNWASDQAALQSGLDLEKVFLATEDRKTRPAHAAADGQVVPMGQPFVVGDEQLMYPGDPAGSAGNVCNCRCSQWYQRVAQVSKTAVITVVPREYRSVRAFMEAIA
jgi:HK97 family phage portal protein